MGYYHSLLKLFFISVTAPGLKMPQKTEADKLDSVEERPVIIRCRRKTNGEGCLEHGLANLLVAVDSEGYERFRKNVRGSV